MHILVKQVGPKSECHVKPYFDEAKSLVFSIPREIKGQHRDVRNQLTDSAVVRAMSYLQQVEKQQSDEPQIANLNRKRANLVMKEIAGHPAYHGGYLDFHLDVELE